MNPHRVFALLLLAAAVLVAALGGRVWWLDTLAITPGSLWSVLALAALSMSVLRSDRVGLLLALPSLALGLVWLGVVWNSSPEAASSLRVIGWNIHGLSENPAERREFLRALAARDADLIALQEAPLEAPEARRDLEASFPGYALYNHREWTVLSRWPILSSTLPPTGGFVRLELEREGRPLALYDVHLETANVFYGPERFERRRAQFALLLSLVAADEAAGRSALVVGDFNTPWHHLELRRLRERWVTSNPPGVSLPLTVPSLLPVARYDYLFGTPGTTFGAYTPLLHERALLGHLGVMSVASLP